MNYFLRKAPVRMAAVASCLVYSNTPNNFKTSVQTLVPVQDAVLSSWMDMQNMLRHQLFYSLDPSRYGNFPFLLSRFSSAESAPPGDITKEASPEFRDGSKPCCGCFSRDTIAKTAARVRPAVVNLSIPRGDLGLDAGTSLGSGTIIDKNGTILTCSNVVEYSKILSTSSNGKVEVTLQDGRVFEGSIVNACIRSDIALVKINSESLLPCAKLGSSSKLHPGEWVVAVGCPFPVQTSITAGILSCLVSKGSDLVNGGMQREYLLTNGAINAGNSGGPLVNIDGEVIGVNINAASEGFGFSVPIDALSKSLEHFRTKGKFVRPWLGLSMIDLDDMTVADVKERDPSFPSVSKGILVPWVVPGSPADRSDLRPADVIVEFDGIPVESVNEITDILGEKAGKPIKVRVIRSNDVSVTLTVIAEEEFDVD